MKKSISIIFALFLLAVTMPAYAWTDCTTFGMAYAHTDPLGNQASSTSYICRGGTFYLKNISVHCQDGTKASDPADGYYKIYVSPTNINCLVGGSQYVPVGDWPVDGVIAVEAPYAISPGHWNLYVEWVPGTSCQQPKACPTYNQYRDMLYLDIITPINPVISDVTICEGDAVILTPTAPTGPGIDYEWATSPGGPAIFTGTSFSPPSPSATTTFYVRAFNSQCMGEETAVTVTVNPAPVVNGYASLICPGECITIGTQAIAGHYYSWRPDGQTTNYITVCPNTSQEYTLTVVNPWTNCTKTVSFPVTVLPPVVSNFNTSINHLSGYYNVSATATTALPSNSTVTWVVEALDNNFQPIAGSQSINNYGSTHPEPGISSGPLTFSGYNYPNWVGGNNNPINGKFYYGYNYRITRTVNHYCLESPEVSTMVWGFKSTGERREIPSNPPAGSTAGSVTGIQDITLYPNPSNGTVYLYYDNITVNRIEIIDHTGRLVKSLDNEIGRSIDVSDLSPGIYYLNFTSDNGNLVKRLIKK